MNDLNILAKKIIISIGIVIVPLAFIAGGLYLLQLLLTH